MRSARVRSWRGGRRRAQGAGRRSTGVGGAGAGNRRGPIEGGIETGETWATGRHLPDADPVWGLLSPHSSSAPRARQAGAMSQVRALCRCGVSSGEHRLKTLHVATNVVGVFSFLRVVLTTSGIVYVYLLDV
jgi:hypothetical protein